MKTLSKVAILSVLIGSACAAPTTTTNEATDVQTTRSDELNDFFESVFQAGLARSPQRQNNLGIKGDYDRWDDNSPEQAEREFQISKADLKRMRAEFGDDELESSAALSYQLFEFESEDEIAAYKWRLHSYPVNQMFGGHSSVISFLNNVHRIDNTQDAEGYIARLRGIGPLFEHLRANLSKRQAAGVLPPAFVFPMVIDDCQNIITGLPFANEADATDSVLLADFRKKVAEVTDLSSTQRESLIDSASAALLEVVGPAYQQLIALLQRQQMVATRDDGIWKLPNGAEYYAWQLKHHTSTDLSADEIHKLGLSEVNRIHAEMRTLMELVEYQDNLNEFFDYLRVDERFFYPNTDEGRARYLAEATKIIETMKGRLDELFITKPKSDLIVKAVEEYRAASAGKAFYNRGAPDGSRPGTYYANLHDMNAMPTYQMEALAYHEGIPGHHMQGSMAMELEDVPMFRRYGNYTSYGEGWGLYTEKLPKEMGFYEDPYSDFGRLAMELWRACRLVVDTGIHHLRWTREEAIDFLRTNTPNPEGDCINAIERYIVMPGQATAYSVGMLEILRLRAEAKAELGDHFDIREFHEVVLTNGAVPLPILGDLVKRWIAQRSQSMN
ncbi:MAG: hypothetical protein ACI8TQ_003847 [Planctomycetota bacterium]|jgi:uncharacterized protein (DUF885 family)